MPFARRRRRPSLAPWPIVLALVAALGGLSGCAGPDREAGGATLERDGAPHGDDQVAIPAEVLEKEARHLSGSRQLTFEGRKSGESYFSPDGRHIAFMAVRGEYPFFRIFEMNADGSDQRLVGPERGKQTCPYYSPDGRYLLFASSHLDPELGKKEAAALEELRKPYDERRGRYRWDFDAAYDIFEMDRKTGEMRRLTDAPGYDAECAYSPDGERIVFTSTRDGNPELYVMDRDGSNQTRLTDKIGYDGGPFFSPDGRRIIFRADREKTDLLQIYVMDADGRNEKQLTNNRAVNWGPFWHPSGERIIYATSRHGHVNYELYMCDLDGENSERITYWEGFDGLPAFSPQGDRLLWTTRRGDGKRSQVFVADWED